MRISDWSSDVCSSDLLALGRHTGQVEAGVGGRHIRRGLQIQVDRADKTAFSHDRSTLHAVQQLAHGLPRTKIGRATCRESACQYVEISVVAVSIEKNNKNQT